MWKERAVGRLSARLWRALGGASLRLLLVLSPIMAVIAFDQDAWTLLWTVPFQIGLLFLLVLYAVVTKPFRKHLRLWGTPAA